MSFFSAMTFIRKTNQGIGIFVAGLLLQFVGFPDGVAPGTVDDSILWNLGALLVPCQLILWGLMLWALVYYQIDKEAHAAHLSQLGRE